MKVKKAYCAEEGMQIICLHISGCFWGVFIANHPVCPFRYGIWRGEALNEPLTPGVTFCCLAASIGFAVAGLIRR